MWDSWLLRVFGARQKWDGWELWRTSGSHDPGGRGHSQMPLLSLFSSPPPLSLPFLLLRGPADSREPHFMRVSEDTLGHFSAANKSQ